MENLSKSNKAPLCKCGCGLPVTWNKWRKRWNTYLKGHQTKGKKGYKHTAESKKKMSDAAKGKKNSAETCKKISKVLTGRKQSAEHRKNHSGSNNPKWKGGVSLENSPSELTPELKQAIRRRDDFSCAFCGLKIAGKHTRFHVHHIDDNRKNNHPDNLITLCPTCHRQARIIGDEAAWQRVCANLIKKIKRENPVLHKAAIKIYQDNMRIYYDN